MLESDGQRAQKKQNTLTAAKGSTGQTDRQCPVSKEKVNTSHRAPAGSQHPPMANHRPQMVSSHYNRELLILSHRLSNCNIPRQKRWRQKGRQRSHPTTQHGENSHFVLQWSFHCWETQLFLLVSRSQWIHTSIHNPTRAEKSALSSWHNSSLFNRLQQAAQFQIPLLNTKEKNKSIQGGSGC